MSWLLNSLVAFFSDFLSSSSAPWNPLSSPPSLTTKYLIGEAHKKVVIVVRVVFCFRFVFHPIFLCVGFRVLLFDISLGATR